MNRAIDVGVIVSAYITVSVVGAYIIRAILMRYEVDRGGGGLRSAGTAIGIIERVMVLTFVLVDQYTAILSSLQPNLSRDLMNCRIGTWLNII